MKIVSACLIAILGSFYAYGNPPELNPEKAHRDKAPLTRELKAGNSQDEKNKKGEGLKNRKNYPPQKGPTPPHKITLEEAQMLKTLFLMPNEDLARLRQMISHLERMPIERRKAMAKDLEELMAASPEERQKVMEQARKRFQKAQENLLNRYYASIPEEQANAEREKFLKMTREEKHHYIGKIREKLGIKPMHGKESPPPPPEIIEKNK